MKFEYKESRMQAFSIRWFLAVTLLAIGQCLLVQTAQAADKYRAFYYDAKDRLLQVEEVPDSEVNPNSPKRTLLDPTAIAFPTLTKNVFPIFDKKEAKDMSRLATYAVYYTYAGPEPGTGTQMVEANPVKVEDLSFVGERKGMKCLKRDGSDVCTYPKRCHCVAGGCCCY